MATSPTYADLSELYDRFGEADIVRFADETGVLEITGDGPSQVQDAYDGNSVSGSSDEVQAAEQAAETIKDALRDAEAEVDGYLQPSYDVPVATDASETPRIVRRITAQIGHYLLQESPTETAENRYEKAVSDLEKIARGMIELGLQVDGSDAPTGGSRASATQETTTFSDGALDSWRQGNNKFGS